MAYELFSGANQRATVQNNCKVLRLRYQPENPVQVALGQEFDISSIIPENAALTVLFKTKKQGTFDIMSLLPLRALCALAGLESKNIAFIFANSNNELAIAGAGEGTATGSIDVTAPMNLVGTPVVGTITDVNLPVTVTVTGTFSGGIMQNIVAIEFNVPLFSAGRIFSDGDNLEVVSTGMPANDTLTVFVSDHPFSSNTVKPYRYRTQTVLANNDYQVDFKGNIIFPNDDSKIAFVQLAGNTLVQWTLRDFYINPSDEWVSNKTTYPTSPFIQLDTTYLNSVKFKAAASFNFYYKDVH